MFMLISDAARRAVPLVLAAALAGCSGAADNGALAEAEAQAERNSASDGRIACALAGTKLFDRTCTIEQMSSADGPVLVVGRADAGFRRLLVAKDGRGLVAADGVDEAMVRVIDNGLIEVTVGPDRYRLPATVKGGI